MFIRKYSSTEDASKDIMIMEKNGFEIVDVNVCQAPGKFEDGYGYISESIIVVARKTEELA